MVGMRRVMFRGAHLLNIYQRGELIGKGTPMITVATKMGREGFSVARKVPLSEIEIRQLESEEPEQASVYRKYPAGSWIPRILWGIVSKHYEEIAEVTIYDAGVSVRLANVLDWKGVKKIGDILEMPICDLLRQRGFGRVSLAELQKTLEKLIIDRNYK